VQLLNRLFRRNQIAKELAQELKAHLEEKAEALMGEGMDRLSAERAARLAFGNISHTEQQSHVVWQWPRLERLLADVRYGARRLTKSFGITTVAIMTLALGLGASTAVFTLTWNVVLKSLPVPQPRRLVEYAMSNGVASPGVSGPIYNLLRERQHTSTDLLGWTTDKNVIVRHGTQTSLRTLQMISRNGLRVLELQPALGSGFDGQPEPYFPAILSFDFWQTEFGGSPAALGQTLVIANHSFTVVGVMPRAFTGLTANLPPSVYVPLPFATVLDSADYLSMAGNLHLSVLGRLRPGVSLSAARAEARALEPALRRDADPSGIYLGQFFKDFHLTVQPGSSGNSWLRATYEKPLLILELLVAFLLLLCIANTTLVMLARISGRQHEYALSLALGARRTAIFQQVVVETSLLALPGLVLGLLLGWAGAHYLVSTLGADWAQTADASQFAVRPNGVIIAVNTAVTLIIALSTGLIPALRAARSSPAFDLKATDRAIAKGGVGPWPIAVQVALSVCMVSAAFLLGDALLRLLTEHSGFKLQNAATATIDLSPLHWSGPDGTRAFARFADALRAQPGVQQVGFTGNLPLSGHFAVSRAFSIDQQHHIHSEPSVYVTTVTPEYFAGAGTDLISGKPSQSSYPPGKGAQNCVLNKALGRSYFPAESPINQLIYFSTSGKPDGAVLDPAASCRIVGVAEDSRYVSLRQPAPLTIYQMFDVATNSEYSTGKYIEVIVRAATESLALDAIHHAITQELPKTAITHSDTFIGRAAIDLGRERMLASLSGSFALLALLLTGLGLYGLLMRTVAMRGREIGIRLALGASRRFILVPLARQVFHGVGAGLAGGVVLAFVLDQTISRLFDLHASQFIEGSVIAALLVCAISVTAVVPPARRAAAVDPMEALRAE